MEAERGALAETANAPAPAMEAQTSEPEGDAGKLVVETVIVETVSAEPPTVETEITVPEPASAHVLATPANDVAQEPAVRPIVIGGSEAPPAEKKRGWWRR